MWIGSTRETRSSHRTASTRPASPNSPALTHNARSSGFISLPLSANSPASTVFQCPLPVKRREKGWWWCPARARILTGDERKWRGRQIPAGRQADSFIDKQAAQAYHLGTNRWGNGV